MTFLWNTVIISVIILICKIGKQRTKELYDLLKVFWLLNRIVEMKSDWINDFTLFSCVLSSFRKEPVTK